MQIPHSERRYPAPAVHDSDRTGIYFWELSAIVWLAVVAGLIWMHARESTQPPIYDAFTYYYKAKFVWVQLLERHFGLKHLLNIEPSFRPPGTVLMSYPFGFDIDYRAFYFRSVFFPVASVFLAVFVGAWRPESSATAKRLTVLTATFLSTVSLFFYFEPYVGGPPAVSHWGLVDSWLTGLSALAMAAGVRSILSRSLRWGVVATAVSVVAIYSKPSGVLIAAAVGAVVGLGWLWTLRQVWSLPALRRIVLRRTITLYGVQAVLLILAVVIATRSNYLGSANMTYGKAAIDVMRAEMQIEWSVLLGIVQSGLGPFVPAWALLVGVLWLYRRWSTRRVTVEHRGSDDLLILMSAVLLAGGLYFWLVGSGGQTQIRYFAPFLYAAVFCGLPALIRTLSGSAPLVRWLICTLMSVAVVNITLLIALPNPSLAWQLASGVNVKSGTRPASIAQAKALIASTRTTSSTVIVYSFVQGMPDAMFESVFDVHSLEVASPRFAIHRPVDWQRPTTFRIDEIVTSDYILFDPGLAQATLPDRVDNFNVEQVVFHSWANGSTSQDGVERISSEANSAVLKITDRAALRKSLESLVAAHHWRDVFLANNGEKWWSDEKVKEFLVKAPAAIEDVGFEDKFTIRAVSLVRFPDGNADLNLWLRPKPGAVESDFVLLLHFVDSKGNGISSRDLGLGAMEAPPEGRPDWLLQFKLVPPNNAASIAIGIYRGTSYLTADKGERDWGGHRFLLKLPQVPH